MKSWIICGIAAGSLVSACGGKTYVPAKAVLYAAYQSEDVVSDFLLGRMIPLGDGSIGAMREALSSPQTRFFDARGNTQFVESPSNPFGSNEDRKRAALGIAAAASGSCSGAIGVRFDKATIRNQRITIQRQALVDTVDRQYTRELGACCSQPDKSCLQWVVNSAYLATVEFDVRSTSDLSVGGAFNCTAPTSLTGDAPPPASSSSTHRESTAAPASSASESTEPSPSTTALSPESTAPPRDTSLLTASRSPGAAITGSVVSRKNRHVHIRSTGWNLIEALPTKQVCLEWKRACRIYGNDSEGRRKYACN